VGSLLRAAQKAGPRAAKGAASSGGVLGISWVLSPLGAPCPGQSMAGSRAWSLVPRPLTRRLLAFTFLYYLLHAAREPCTDLSLWATGIARMLGDPPGCSKLTGAPARQPAPLQLLIWERGSP